MRKPGYLVVILLVAFVSFFAGNLMKQRPVLKVRFLNNIILKRQPFPRDLRRSAPVSKRVQDQPGKTADRRNTNRRSGKKTLIHMVRLLGRVAPDETRLYFINATVDGWITEDHANTTGSYVRRNETLATFYSPEFLSATQALLFALSAKDRAQTTGRETPAQKDQLAQFEINLKQYRDSLRNLGMGDLQIDEMIDRRRYTENVNITSPTDGIILFRSISRGLRFEKGRELYRIADLSRVWILADVFEYEAQFFKPGSKATVWLPYQKKKYQATVSEVLPIFDPVTRTLKVRLETDNPGFILRPDMYVDVELPIRCLLPLRFLQMPFSTRGSGRLSLSIGATGSSNRERWKQGTTWATG